MDSKFAWVAKEDGKVIEKSNKHIAVKYTSGKVDKVELGTIYGVSVGKVINNTLTSDYKIGQTVKRGDVVAYNIFHFVRDYFNPSQVVFKNSVLARTCFMECNDTEEDGSAISLRLADELTTLTTKVRTIIVPFEDNIENLVNIGDKVDTDSILCTLVNAVFTDNALFDDEALDTLGKIAKSSPKANYPGVVKHMDLLYYGDPEVAKVSPSIRKLIQRLDMERTEVAERLDDKRSPTGRVLESTRIDGNPLPSNHIALKIYIENMDGTGSGDKIVFGNQLKSVLSRVMSGVNETKSGKPIDAIFGYQSISNRIVQSAELIGTTNTLLKLISKEVVDIYRKHQKQK